MAITKLQASVLSQDMMLRGVIETIVKESQLLAYLPFMEVTGTALTYNREASMPAVNFYAPLETWSEATPTFQQESTALTIIGGDADVDNFLQQTYADHNDIEAEVIANRAKAVAHKYSDAFFNGILSGNSFAGVHSLIPTPQTLTNGGPLTLNKLDELIDMVRPGKPDVLLMSKRTRRKLKQLRREDNISTEVHLNEFGQQVEFYDGIPIVVDDFIKDDQTIGTGTNMSTVYAMRFGAGSGVCGLENGGIQIERVGELETKDATRTRIKWYCGLALFSELAAAKLTGVSGT